MEARLLRNEIAGRYREESRKACTVDVTAVIGAISW